jgi:hypothetical protein
MVAGRRGRLDFPEGWCRRVPAGGPRRHRCHVGPSGARTFPADAPGCPRKPAPIRASIDPTPRLDAHWRRRPASGAGVFACGSNRRRPRMVFQQRMSIIRGASGVRVSADTGGEGHTRKAVWKGRKQGCYRVTGSFKSRASASSATRPGLTGYRFATRPQALPGPPSYGCCANVLWPGGMPTPSVAWA